MNSLDEENYMMRLSDKPVEDQEMVAPIQGYQKVPLVPLEHAVKPLESILPGIQEKVKHARHVCENQTDNLTLEESAAIYLYTCEWEPREKGLYYILNDTLRKRVRTSLECWFLYLKLLMTGLSKLPSRQGVFYRGVKQDISEYYPDGKKFVWWSFTSTTCLPSTLENSIFFGKTGARTLFYIDSYSGRDIRQFSSVKIEEEILLPVGRQFQVDRSTDMGDGLTIIIVKEIEPEHPLLEPDLLDPLSRTAAKASQYTNPKLEKLIDDSQSEDLDLACQRLDDQDMLIVALKAIRKGRITKLNLMQNHITSVGASILADGFHYRNSSIKELVVSQNHISDEGVRALATTMTGTILMKLDLSENEISDKGVVYLAKMITNNQNLVELLLQQNDIANEGVKMLADCIVRSKTFLQVLNLYNNRKINDESIAHFINIMENNQSLKKLDVRGCSLSKDGEARLQQVATLKKGFKIWLANFL